MQIAEYQVLQQWNNAGCHEAACLWLKLMCLSAVETCRVPATTESADKDDAEHAAS
jgi:hypothetical protein